MKLSVELVNSNGENLLKKELEVKGSEWQKLTAVLKAPFTDVRSRLRVVLQTEGTVDMDHISLFPVNTWKKRENGLEEFRGSGREPSFERKSLELYIQA